MPKRQMKSSFKGIIAILVIFAFGIGIFIGGAITATVAYVKYPKEYLEFYNTVTKTYDGEIDEFKMKEAIFAGIAAGTGDPHTVYMTKSEAEQFQSSLNSSYVGIGIGIEKNQENNILVTFVSETGSARKKGILPGDVILKLNDEKTTEMTTDEFVQKVKAEKQVSLEYSRPTNNNAIGKADMAVEEIIQENIYSTVFENDQKKYGYIKIYEFGRDVAVDFQNQLTKLEAQNISGLIIDVRDNSGGYLQETENIMNLLVPNSKPAYITKIGNTIANQFTTSLTKEKYDIAVLQNQESASASEILSGALKEINGSQVIGTTSYGKGSVQSQLEIPTGGILKITSQHWYTPDDNLIDGKGIEPTIKLENQIGYGYQFPLTREYKVGLSSIEAQQINNNLAALGYNTKVDSEDFTTTTESAVRQFQKQSGLKETGIVDAKTMYELTILASKKGLNPNFDKSIETAIISFEKE